MMRSAAGRGLRRSYTIHRNATNGNATNAVAMAGQRKGTRRHERARGRRVRRPKGSSGRQYALGLGRVRGDGIHQRRVEAIVRLELQLFQTGAHSAHLVRLGA